MEANQQQKKSFAEKELDILKFWEKEKVFQKSLDKKSPRGDFVFYDGPPFANGTAHYGHLLASTIKDVIPRFKTMQGFHVPRRWGWDCHGLPVENEVEKELGFKTKKEIEQYGVGKFNARAKELVMRYAGDWRKIIPRLGRWVDMDNDYRTMDSSYTETVWWVFKNLFDKGLIYQGFKSMHLCPRCETTVSNFEVTQGYKEITDTSVYVKFQILNPQFPNTYAVAWTTTPWTLIGNAALAVNPNRDYAFVEITASNSSEIQAGDTYIIGADELILRRVFGTEELKFDSVARVGSFVWKGEQVAFSAKKGMKGKELIGQSYQPLFGYYSNQLRSDFKSEERSDLYRNGWRIYAGEFVTEEDGTGIVHIAPAFGEDDYQLALKEKLPFIQHIAADGTFTKEVSDFAGLQAKPKGNPQETDEKISAFLAARKLLLRAEPFTHEYPHCWRCDTPLLNYAAPSWFVKVTKLREKLVEENKKINWIPKEVGEYRFGNWLSEAKDWAISRSRFWGAPIPVWKCERCKEIKAVGSMDDIRAGSKERFTKVIIVRHGESKKNTKNIFDDSPNAFPLTHQGRKDAKESARRISEMGGVDVIYSSPVRRAKETALIIGARLGKGVIIEEDLREVDSGRWDGMREDDPSFADERAARRALSGEAFYKDKRGTTGESWEDVEKRMNAALKRIMAKHQGESVLLVSHEGPIIYLLKTIGYFLQEDIERFDQKDLLGGFAKPTVVYMDAQSGKVFDKHRPFIDSIALNCVSCAKSTGTGKELMKRVPEVFDCWFESGAMPYGQAHYPFEYDGKFEPNEGWFKKARGFPAHFIAEGLDQTRGWFYSMLVLGVALFEKSPYQSVIVNGIILAENGEKMSKRLKNYPDPSEIVSKYGADALRYYLLSSPVVRGEELRFSERGVDEVVKKVFNRLDNVLAFFLLYVDSVKDKGLRITDSSNVLDRWILARLNQLISEVTGALEKYELDKATRPIGEFVDDLSTWYLRRSRERIKSDALEEKEAALGTLGFVLEELAKVTAPFAPFFGEYLYQKLDTNLRIEDSNDTNKIRSVHLESWPSGEKIDAELLKEMEEVRKIVSLGLEARAKANIKVRQPLGKLKIKSEKVKIEDGLRQLIQDEINVKEIILDSAIQNEVELDTTLTPELKDEGQFRELTRFVQEMRKKKGFRTGEMAVLSVGATGAPRRFIEQHEQELSRIASLKNILIQDELSGGEPFQADDISFSLILAKE